MLYEKRHICDEKRKRKIEIFVPDKKKEDKNEDYEPSGLPDMQFGAESSIAESKPIARLDSY